MFRLYFNFLPVGLDRHLSGGGIQLDIVSGRLLDSFFKNLVFDFFLAGGERTGKGENGNRYDGRAKKGFALHGKWYRNDKRMRLLNITLSMYAIGEQQETDPGRLIACLPF